MRFLRNDSPTQRRLTLLAVVLIAVLLAATIAASFTVMQPPTAVTHEARQIRWLYELVLALAMFVFFGVEALLIWAVLRYRKRSTEPAPQVHGNNRLEFAWTGIPFAVLAVLFSLSIPLIVSLRNPPEAAAETVNVVGHQWFWEFDYPNENIKVLEAPNYDNVQPPALVVPAGVTVDLKITSGDVVHSFYVPQFLYKMQAIPGQVNTMHFRIDKPGDYDGQCAQFCGLHHDKMRFVVRAMTQSDFNQWVRDQQAKAPPPVTPAAPTPQASPAPGQPSAQALTLVAKNIAFDQTSLTVTAGAPVTVTFDNQDSGVPHNIHFALDKDFTQTLDNAKTDIATGPAKQTVTFTAPEAGTYYYRCDVHPQQMSGTLTVQ